MMLDYRLFFLHRGKKNIGEMKRSAVVWVVSVALSMVSRGFFFFENVEDVESVREVRRRWTKE